MSPTRRLAPLLIASAAVIAAACSDAVAPTRSTTEPGVSTVAAPGGSPAYAKHANNGAEAGAQTIVFKIFPQRGTAKIGGFTLIYPDRAVCDPGKSGYGPNEWKKDCAPLRGAITIRGKVWVEDGKTLVDFSPDIRFDPSKTVYLATIIPNIVGRPLSEVLLENWRIGFWTRQGNDRTFFDDGSGDLDLATIFGTSATDPTRANGWAKRRVYHFSGYFVREGIWCDPDAGFLDPLCLETPPQ